MPALRCSIRTSTGAVDGVLHATARAQNHTELCLHNPTTMLNGIRLARGRAAQRAVVSSMLSLVGAPGPSFATGGDQ